MISKLCDQETNFVSASDLKIIETIGNGFVICLSHDNFLRVCKKGDRILVADVFTSEPGIYQLSYQDEVTAELSLLVLPDKVEVI